MVPQAVSAFVRVLAQAGQASVLVASAVPPAGSVFVQVLAPAVLAARPAALAFYLVLEPEDLEFLARVMYRLPRLMLRPPPFAPPTTLRSITPRLLLGIQMLGRLST